MSMQQGWSTEREGNFLSKRGDVLISSCCLCTSTSNYCQSVLMWVLMPVDTEGYHRTVYTIVCALPGSEYRLSTTCSIMLTPRPVSCRSNTFSQRFPFNPQSGFIACLTVRLPLISSVSTNARNIAVVAEPSREESDKSNMAVARNPIVIRLVIQLLYGSFDDALAADGKMCKLDISVSPAAVWNDRSSLQCLICIWKLPVSMHLKYSTVCTLSSRNCGVV